MFAVETEAFTGERFFFEGLLARGVAVSCGDKVDCRRQIMCSGCGYDSGAGVEEFGQ